MNKKQTVRLNESQLKRVIAESVKRVLNETLSHDFDMYDINHVNVESVRDIYEIAQEAFGINGGRQRAITIDFHYKGKIIELIATAVPDGPMWGERYYSIKLKVWNEGEEKPQHHIVIASGYQGYDLDYSKLEKGIEKFVPTNQPRDWSDMTDEEREEFFAKLKQQM